MKKILLQIISVVVCVSLFTSVFAINGVSAATASELRNSISELEAKSKKLESEIKGLQGKINEQQKLKNTINQKISVVQQQINLCNNQISKINSAIAANNTEIDNINKEIESDKLSFKKRLRAIYMSNTGSNVQVLLGADDFADFLQLSQLTASVSARDKLLLEKLTTAMQQVEAKKKENEGLLAEQVEIKKIVTEKQKELQSENNAIQQVINDIDSEQNKLEKTNASLEKQIKDYQKMLNSMASVGNTSFVYDGGDFLWPVPGYYMITAGFQSNDPIHKGSHNGIDIAGSGIAGKPIIAISDGIVTKANNSCTHNYKKYSSCGCAYGYGNYVTINHGTKDGKTYSVTYGHMTSTAVGVGATVKKGQTIGYVGTTGFSTGYHLHFAIAVNGVWRNPMNFYSKVK